MKNKTSESSYWSHLEKTDSLSKKFKRLTKNKGLGSAGIKFIKFLIREGVEWPLYRTYFITKSKVSRKIINNPYEFVCVPTSLINYKLTERFPPHASKWKKIINKVPRAGFILDGDWDTHREKIKEIPSFIGFKERFVEKKEWEEVTHFKDIKNNFERGKTGRGTSKSWEEYKKIYLESWDKLYESMKNEGYKSQRELKNGRPERETQICISRNGEILRPPGGAGWHRFMIAKLLGVENMTAIVNVWHKDFVEKVEKETDKKKITPNLMEKYLLKTKLSKNKINY